MAMECIMAQMGPEQAQAAATGPELAVQASRI